MIDLGTGVVVEGVVDAGIDVNPHLGLACEMGADGLHCLLRHEGVCAGEVHEHGAGDAAGFVERLLDADAVEGDRGVHVVAGGGEVGELAAEAKAHGGDGAGALGQRPQRLQRRADVGDAPVHVETPVEVEGPGEVVVAVAESTPGSMRQKRSGHEADIALLGIESRRPRAGSH